MTDLIPALTDCSETHVIVDAWGEYLHGVDDHVGRAIDAAVQRIKTLEAAIPPSGPSVPEITHEGAWAMQMERVREAAQNYGRDTLLLGKARAYLPDGSNEQFEKAVDARWQAFEQSLFVLTDLAAAPRPSRTEVEGALNAYGQSVARLIRGSDPRYGDFPGCRKKVNQTYEAVMALLAGPGEEPT